MYSLNDDLQNNRSGRGIDYFKPGINVHFMNLKGDATIAFRMLPAYDPATVRLNPTTNAYEPTVPNSWVPFRDPQSGQVQTWARKISVAAYVGHGRNQAGRRINILCMETFKDQMTGQAYCPVQTLIDYIQSNREWQYLMDDIKGPDGKTVLESKALGYPTVLMLANIVLPTQSPKVELGVFKLSAYKSLFNKDKQPFGLVYQEAIITDPSVLQTNPMARWAYGDITDPVKGFVLALSRDSSQYGEYHVSIYTSNGLAYPYPIGDDLLAKRNNLLNIDALVRRPSDDETIGQLVKVLNGVNPVTREHEWLLLHRVFDSVASRGTIPEPPKQGYVQGYSMPAGQAPGQAPNQLQGLPFPAQQPQPFQQQQQPPFQGQQAPSPFPQQQQPFQGQSTGQPPPSPSQQPQVQQQAPPPFPGVSGTPVGQPPRAADTAPFVPSAAAPAAGAAPGAGQPRPGDPPDAKARDQFLAQLQGAFAGRPQG